MVNTCMRSIDICAIVISTINIVCYIILYYIIVIMIIINITSFAGWSLASCKIEANE